MPVLNDRVDAILYLLDYMVGIDKILDEKESDYFIQTAFGLLQGNFVQIQEKIQWITKLWREHERDSLFEEACAILKEHDHLQEDLKLLRKMAAIDGKIDPAEQKLFERICQQLGVPAETLTV